MLARSLVTLSEKNVANCWTVDDIEEMSGKAGFEDLWRRLLTVFQSKRGLEMLSEISLEWYNFLAASMAWW